MKILLEIPEDKVSFIMELLHSFPFLKTEKIVQEKASVVQDLKEAVSEMNAIKKGTAKSVPLQDFLNEL